MERFTPKSDIKNFNPDTQGPWFEQVIQFNLIQFSVQLN